MKVIKDIKLMQQTADELRRQGKTIGFVPTMGFLHDGHLSLIQQSKKHADITIVSIYVNPTQFAPNEDFNKYPRDFEHDEHLCQNAGVDIVFYPDNSQMYLENHFTYVITENLASKLCGKSRPDHFRGVTTIVSKLFNIIKPHIAIFGQKDAQQSVIIQKMVRDLNFDIDIKIAPIIRESDGLAMSSRNKYLSTQQRKDAAIINSALKEAKELISNGEEKAQIVQQSITKKLQDISNSKIDYISIVDMQNLEPVEHISKDILIAVAVFIGSTRLIDNIII